MTVSAVIVDVIICFCHDIVDMPVTSRVQLTGQSVTLGAGEENTAEVRAKFAMHVSRYVCSAD